MIVWPYAIIMATPKIKATYSLDVETVRALERTAERWQVSKSEVLRRAIQAVSGADAPAAQDQALAALDALQEAIDLSPSAASSWQTQLRHERRAYSKRRESHSR
jgi:Zn-dependent peptidase ImmA (M78 family)